MEETIRVYEDAKEIEKILITFQETLKSLNRGERFIRQMSKKFSRFGKVIGILNENDEIMGFAAFYCNDEVSKKAYLSMIAVIGEYQGLGIGRKLLNIVENICRSCNMVMLQLEVNKDNFKAISFYRMNGYSMYEVYDKSYIYGKLLL